MRPYPFEPASSQGNAPVDLSEGLPPPAYSGRFDYQPAPPEPYTTNLPVVRRRNYWRWFTRGIGILIILFVLAVGWLAVTAPLSQSLKPRPRRASRCSPTTGHRSRGAARSSARRSMRQSCPKTSPTPFSRSRTGASGRIGAVDPKGIIRAFVHNMSRGAGARGRQHHHRSSSPRTPFSIRTGRRRARCAR